MLTPHGLAVLKTYDVAMRWGVPGLAREVIKQRLQEIERCSHCLCTATQHDYICCRCNTNIPR